MSRVKLVLSPCPFCGAKIGNKFPNISNYDKNKWCITHNCEHPVGRLGVTVVVYGSTKKEVVDRWNNRVEDLTRKTEDHS